MSEETLNQTEMETIKNNSEILFIYDARMCNPNGDPDDENKPRMDYNRSINLVSDLRLKRYIRDYLIDYKDKTIFVSKVGGETVDATKRLKKLIEENKKDIDSNETLKDLFDNNNPNEKNLSKHLPWLLSKLTDVRLFGATMPLKSEGSKGSSITFTGPIQFNWGYSLNKVTGPMDSSTITSTFAGASEDHSTMGKDYRLDYSLIAFHGIISAKRAEYTLLTDEDIDLFDDAMIHAIPLEATTRSKTGQYPLLYIRIEYNNSEFFIGDLRRHVKIINKDGKEMLFDETTKLRSPTDYSLDLTKLGEKVGEYKGKISSVHFWKHGDLEVKGLGIENDKLKINGDEIDIVKLPKQENES
ncbi:MAG: type I-B CRISPR-associated protein Cas7/Csh2 [Halobacteriota archaeon]|nr:type I-B CRISPR-associated protein Cas7/Csh2 [Halobacteriota archaeon]